MKRLASAILAISMAVSFMPVPAAEDKDIITQAEEFTEYIKDNSKTELSELAKADMLSGAGTGGGIDVDGSVIKSVFFDVGCEAVYEVNVPSTGVYTLKLNAGVRRINTHIRPIIKADGTEIFNHSVYTELKNGGTMTYTSFAETEMGEIELKKGIHTISVGLRESEENSGYAQRFLLDSISLSYSGNSEVEIISIPAEGETVIDAVKYDPYASIPVGDNITEADIYGVRAVSLSSGDILSYGISAEGAKIYELYAEAAAETECSVMFDINIDNRLTKGAAEIQEGSMERVYIGKVSVMPGDAVITLGSDTDIILKSIVLVPLDETAPEVERSAIVVDAKDASAFHIDTSIWVVGDEGVVNGGVDHSWRNAGQIETTADGVTLRILDWLEYEVDVPAAGRYLFSMFVGSDRNVPFVVTVNGNRKGAYEFNMTLTNQQMTKELQDLATITLEEGKNTIRIAQEDESRNFNAEIGYFKLAYLDDFPIIAYRANGKDLGGADDVFRGTDTIDIYFGGELDPATVDATSASLVSENGEEIPFEADVNGNIMSLKLKRSLEYETEYKLTVSDSVRSLQGVRITNDKETSFKTAGVSYDLANDKLTELYSTIDYEELTFGGKVVSSNGLTMSGRQVIAKITAPSGRYIDTVTGVTDGEGCFEIGYTIADGSERGYYNISVKDEYSVSTELKALYISREVEKSLISAIRSTSDATEVKAVLEDYENEAGYSLDDDTAELTDPDNFYAQFVGRDLVNSEGFVSFYAYALAAETIRQAWSDSMIESRVYNKALLDNIGIDHAAVSQIVENKVEFLAAVRGISSVKECDEYTAQLQTLVNTYLAREFLKAPEIEAADAAIYVGQGAEIPVSFTAEQTDVVSVAIKATAVDPEILVDVVSRGGTINGNTISFESSSQRLVQLGSFTVTAPAQTGSYKIRLSGEITYKLNGVITHITLDDKEFTVKVTNNTSKNNQTDSNSGKAAGGGGGGGAPTATKAPSQTAQPVEIETEKPQSDEETESGSYRFTDLEGVDWAEQSIYALMNNKNGIISKSDDGLFRPYDDVTREEFTKMIVAALGTYDETLKAEFNDIDPDAWYSAYLASAVASGIITGYDDGSFGIGRSLTRQDATVIADRCVRTYFYNSGSTNRFSDDELISDYARESVYRAERGGIISGMGDGRFAPLASITRAQAAVLINNLISRAGLISGVENASDLSVMGTASSRSVEKKQQSVYKLMRALELIPASFDETRSDMKAQRGVAAYALNVMSGGQAPDMRDIEITDVGEESELYSSAKFAAGAGFLSVKDGIFDAEGNVMADDVTQAMAKIICNDGIHNETTLKQAVTSIRSGVKINLDGTLSYAELFKMIKNALITETFEYESDRKHTLLATRFKVSVYRGTVQTVNPVAYTLNVYIKNDKYKTNPKNIENATETYFAGENVNLYEYEYVDALFWVYDGGSAGDSLLLIEPDDGIAVHNAYIYSVNGDDNAGAAYAGNYIDRIIFYDDNTRYKLASDAKIIYNGIETSSPVPLVGNFVRAVTDNNEIKTLQVWDLYEGGLVTSFAKNVITYTKGDTRGNRIDTEEFSKILLFIDGQNTDIKDLKEKTVFSYYKSIDTLIIVASEKVITGTFETLGTDSLTISGVIYPRQKTYSDISGGGGYEELVSGSGLFGTEIEAYFDAAGYCMYVKAAQKNAYADKYLGIVVKLVEDDPDTESDLMTIYMLEPDIERKTFELDSKVKLLDGIDKELLKDNAMNKNGEGVYEFKFNGEGKIAEISVPEPFPGYASFQVSYVSDSTDNFISSPAGTFYVDLDTRILLMTVDNGECKVEESNWATMRGRTATGGTVTARIYGRKNSSDIRCMLFCGDTPALLRTEASMGIISKMVSSVDKNDNNGYDITIAGMEGDITYFVTEEDGRGLSVGTFLIYDPSSFFTDSGFTIKLKETFKGPLKDWEPENAQLHTGVIKGVDGQMLFLEDGTAKFMHRKFNYVVVDKGEGKSPRFVRGTTADLVPGARIVYYLLGDVQGIFVEDI